MARLTKHQWLEAEEMYRQGFTQKEIAQKFKTRPETISAHMNRESVKGGESIDLVKQELEAAVNRKIKEFAEKRMGRTIDTKEKMHTLINTTLAFFVKELRDAQSSGKSLSQISGAAKSLKEAMSALKVAREELYAILEIKDDANQFNAPDIFVMTMTPEEEERIRGATHVSDEEEELEMQEIQDLAAATEDYENRDSEEKS